MLNFLLMMCLLTLGELWWLHFVNLKCSRFKTVTNQSILIGFCIIHWELGLDFCMISWLTWIYFTGWDTEGVRGLPLKWHSFANLTVSKKHISFSFLCVVRYLNSSFLWYILRCTRFSQLDLCSTWMVVMTEDVSFHLAGAHPIN